MPGRNTPTRTGPGLRWFWWAVAYLALGSAIVGVVLPVLPTVPFVLLAAFAAARGSERLNLRLRHHPRFGPMIADWEADRAVARSSKWLATGAMLVCAAVLFVVAGDWWIPAVVSVIMLVVGTWLWRRPEPA